jgi:hypothetical protein
VDSRGREDLVDGILAELDGTPTRLPFVRTVGDEFQGLLEDPVSVVDVILALMRTGQKFPDRPEPGAGEPPLAHTLHRAGEARTPEPASAGTGGQWHIGLGIGPVETPLPSDSRSARGAAFLAARAAVERAKASPQRVSIEAPPQAKAEAQDAELVLRLLAALRDRRTPQGWQAGDLAAQGYNQGEIAERLGVSRQAISQRLIAAGWALEEDARPVLARLLARTEARSLE